MSLEIKSRETATFPFKKLSCDLNTKKNVYSASDETSSATVLAQCSRSSSASAYSISSSVGTSSSCVLNPMIRHRVLCSGDTRQNIFSSGAGHSMIAALRNVPTTFSGIHRSLLDILFIGPSYGGFAHVEKPADH
jgi:hypothetical protein